MTQRARRIRVLLPLMMSLLHHRFLACHPRQTIIQVLDLVSSRQNCLVPFLHSIASKHSPHIHTTSRTHTRTHNFNIYSSHFPKVHCCVTRCGKNRYHLSIQTQDAESVSIIANKVKSSRTSNYHLFDALRGGTNAKLSKKAGHYIGKLRRDKDQPVGCYTLYNSSREKEQVAAYVYDIPALMQQVTEGQPPRKMQAVVPNIQYRQIMVMAAAKVLIIIEAASQYLERLVDC